MPEHFLLVFLRAPLQVGFPSQQFPEFAEFLWDTVGREIFQHDHDEGIQVFIQDPMFGKIQLVLTPAAVHKAGRENKKHFMAVLYAVKNVPKYGMPRFEIPLVVTYPEPIIFQLFQQVLFGPVGVVLAVRDEGIKEFVAVWATVSKHWPQTPVCCTKKKTRSCLRSF